MTLAAPSTVTLLVGDVRAGLASLPAELAQECVTSVPYWGLRSYGTTPQVWGGDPEHTHEWDVPIKSAFANKTGRANAEGQAWDLGKNGPAHARPREAGNFCACGAWLGELGAEPTPELYVEHIVDVFRAVRRVLRPDGCLFLNLGDSYNAGRNGGWAGGTNGISKPENAQSRSGPNVPGLKPKDLVGMPWRVALALQADGWWWRSTIVWAKKSCMPESVRDRPTNAWEPILLFSKSARYFWDADAVREESQVAPENAWRYEYGRYDKGGIKRGERTGRPDHLTEGNGYLGEPPGGRNQRNVWDLRASEPMSDFWLLGPEPFSGDDLVDGQWFVDQGKADYVGADGKARKVSPDCPEHGLPLVAQTSSTPECDGQSTLSSPHSPDSATRPVLQPPSDSVSTDDFVVASDSRGPSSANSRSAQSTDAHRNDGFQKPEPQRHPRTSRTQRTLVSTSDSQDRGDSLIATDRSSETRKTDLAPSTSQPYNASARTPAGRRDTPASPLIGGLFDHILESNTAVDASLDARGSGPAAQTQRRSGRTAKCSCPIVSVDHFATFPTEVPRRCVLAGTSEKGQCPHCGAPWERITDLERRDTRPGLVSKFDPADTVYSSAGKLLRRPQITSTTTGWRPSCKCPPHEPVPQVVLDPFAGSGTTLMVAARLGRSSIGIELSEPYTNIAVERIREDGGFMVDVQVKKL